MFCYTCTTSGNFSFGLVIYNYSFDVALYAIIQQLLHAVIDYKNNNRLSTSKLKFHHSRSHVGQLYLPVLAICSTQISAKSYLNPTNLFKYTTQSKLPIYKHRSLP